MSKIEIEIKNCNGTEYLLLPACAYNGNSFEVLKRDYPPMFYPSEAKLDMPITITDVPRLEKHGGGKIEVTTGDVSTPCIGVFTKKDGKAILVYTIQQINGINLGLAYEKGKISITYPAKREYIYRWPHMYKNTEEYVDIPTEIPYKVIEFECNNMEEFYKVYFHNRKCMHLCDTRPKILPFDKQFEIQRDKFNKMNWYEKGNYYDIDSKGNWQPGWCGSAMNTYALIKLGSELEKERAIKTLKHLFKTQSQSGFFYGNCDKDYYVYNDGFGLEGTESWHLLRKSADCLYFLFKHFEIMENIPQSFVDGTKKLADAFVRLWNKFGQFGQFADIESGDIVVGGSTSCAIASAGLALAYKYFGNEEYLEIAKQSAEMMYKRDALSGYTTGGPGEILQGPDSESAFSLLESMVVLYELTKEQRWLDYGQFTAHLCSSWVVSYNYKFPSKSEFARLDMKTVGSVFANVQNKHSAPGICTLSGNSLYKLYKWTNNKLYKELYDDIALTISQYMSTDERPIYSWDVPKDASAKNLNHLTVEREKLPQGFICERVNMSDWETERCVGGVFNGSCWSESSNLLTMAEYCT